MLTPIIMIDEEKDTVRRRLDYSTYNNTTGKQETKAIKMTHSKSSPLKLFVLAYAATCYSSYQPAWAFSPIVHHHRTVRLTTHHVLVPSVHPSRRYTSYSARRSKHFTRMTLASSADTPPEDEESSADNKADEVESSAPKNILQRIKSYMSPPDEDGLTVRQRLQKMGLAAVLSYGWVSNVSYAIFVSLAWFAFSTKTGKSPLAPGQWKPFLVVYAGFWAVQNVLRPLRVTLAVAISPQFERAVNGVQRRLGVSRAVAIGSTVVIVNVVGTTICFVAGILLASALAGVPVYAGR